MTSAVFLSFGDIQHLPYPPNYRWVILAPRMFLLLICILYYIICFARDNLGPAPHAAGPGESKPAITLVEQMHISI